MDNGSQPAQPIVRRTQKENDEYGYEYFTAIKADLGLTKREYFAAMIYQGMMAGCQYQDEPINIVAEFAVLRTDALLAALEES